MVQSKNGFTLMELVVVLCLIAIIAGFSVPGIVAAVPGIGLKNAANDLVSDMRLARSLAVKNQETVTINFDTDKGSYQILSATFSKTVNLKDYRGGIKFGAGMATKKASTSADLLPSGYDFVSFNQNTVNFNQNGTNNKYGYVYLCNENNDVGYAVGLSSLAGVLTFRKTKGPDEWMTL